MRGPGVKALSRARSRPSRRPRRFAHNARIAGPRNFGAAASRRSGGPLLSKVTRERARVERTLQDAAHALNSLRLAPSSFSLAPYLLLARGLSVITSPSSFSPPPPSAAGLSVPFFEVLRVERKVADLAGAETGRAGATHWEGAGEGEQRVHCAPRERERGRRRLINAARARRLPASSLAARRALLLFNKADA